MEDVKLKMPRKAGYAFGAGYGILKVEDGNKKRSKYCESIKGGNWSFHRYSIVINGHSIV